MLHRLDGRFHLGRFTLLFSSPFAAAIGHWPLASLPNAFHLLSHDSPLCLLLSALCVFGSQQRPMQGLVATASQRQSYGVSTAKV
ncbi:hypothetical protein GGI43DRAFT_10750 [Trichoderma evansii]